MASKMRHDRTIYHGVDAVLGGDGKRYAMGHGAGKRITEHLTLRASGMTVRAIAAQTGWSYPTVWRDVTQYDLVSGGESDAPETEDKRP